MRQGLFSSRLGVQSVARAARDVLITDMALESFGLEMAVPLLEEDVVRTAGLRYRAIVRDTAANVATLGIATRVEKLVSDVQQYLNDALIPAMYERRSAHICAYTRRYYGHTIFMAYDNVAEDPLLDLVYFVAPTRRYLQAHDLAFSPGMQRQLERNARYSPDGRVWQAITTLHPDVPCAFEIDVSRNSFRVRP